MPKTILAVCAVLAFACSAAAQAPATGATQPRPSVMATTMACQPVQWAYTLSLGPAENVWLETLTPNADGSALPFVVPAGARLMIRTAHVISLAVPETIPGLLGIWSNANADWSRLTSIRSGAPERYEPGIMVSGGRTLHANVQNQDDTNGRAYEVLILGEICAPSPAGR